jgi:hypothetical protein
VYNLTLDSENVYYANGILVANCFDALALTFAIPDQPGGFTIDEAIQSGIVKGFDTSVRRRGGQSSGRIVTDDDAWGQHFTR